MRESGALLCFNRHSSIHIVMPGGGVEGSDDYMIAQVGSPNGENLSVIDVVNEIKHWFPCISKINLARQ